MLTAERMPENNIERKVKEEEGRGDDWRELIQILWPKTQEGGH